MNDLDNAIIDAIKKFCLKFNEAPDSVADISRFLEDKHLVELESMSEEDFIAKLEKVIDKI